jgi:hypothetical protein
MEDTLADEDDDLNVPLDDEKKYLDKYKKILGM